MATSGFEGRCDGRLREQSGKTRSVEDMMAKSQSQSAQKDPVEVGNWLATRIKA